MTVQRTVLEAGRAQLAPIPGIMALRFQYDGCAPSAARWEFLVGTAGNVIASLSDGLEIAVFVSLDDDGAVHADAARPFSSESQPTPLPGG